MRCAPLRTVRASDQLFRPDRAALVEHCRKLLEPWGINVRDETIRVALHQASADKRNGWPATYTVTVSDYGVLGFADSAV